MSLTLRQISFFPLRSEVVLKMRQLLLEGAFRQNVHAVWQKSPTMASRRSRSRFCQGALHGEPNEVYYTS